MKAICANPACQQPFEANATHYRRGIKQYCSKACLLAGFAPLTLAERFWPRVDTTSSPDGCWIWTGHKDKNSGYGVVKEPIPGTNKKRLLRAHRVAYTLLYGPIPDGLLVLHKPPCCNRLCMRHLYLGTPQDNADDRAQLGHTATGDRNGSRVHRERMPRGDDNPARRHPERMARGERHSKATLTDLEVATIRAVYTGQRGHMTALARQYHVSQVTIANILKGRTRRS
jgi:hypothetical protein